MNWDTTIKEIFIMENIIVATFKNEGSAIQGLHKLGELEREGDINVYDKVMIRKGSNGEYEVLKNDNSDGWRTIAGLAFGGMIGAFGGPIGFAVGLYAGAVIGGVIDYTHYMFDQDFIETMSRNVPAGSTSIIAEVDEGSSVFIDEFLKPLGAVIWRSNVYVENDRFVKKQISDLDAEIKNAENELVSTVEAQKEAVATKVTELRHNRNTKIAEIEMRGKEALQELKAKMESNKAKLQTQFANIQNQVSDKIDSVRLERSKQKLAKYELKIDELNEKLSNFKHPQTV
jgi:uncharacterized membrane protein